MSLQLSTAILGAEFVDPVPLHGTRRAVPTSGFRTSSRPGHDGVDMLYPLWASDGPIASPNTDGKGKWWFPSGKSIVASAAGVVLHAKYIASGGYVYIKHANGVATEYIHLAEVLVAPSQPVAKGEVIGVAGKGNSGLVHLHFQMRLNGTLVDPEPYLTHMPAIRDPREVGGAVFWAAGGAGVYFLWRYLRRRYQ